MKVAVEHIGLAAREPGVLANWYCAVLGANLIFQTDTEPPAFFVQFGNGLILEFYSAERSSNDTSFNRLAGWRHLALRVDSIDLARKHLESKSVQFEESAKPAGGGGQVLFFHDLEGNLLHLVERPAHSFATKALLG